MSKVIRIGECEPTPWKNGAGSTRELYRLVDEHGRVLLRVSIAEISGAQPFSLFLGIDRTIMQLDGPAMTLCINGTSHALKQGVPLPFAGEDAVSCELGQDGVAHDLNLMCNRAHYKGSIEVRSMQPGEVVEGNDAEALQVILMLEPGAIYVGEEAMHLGRHDAVILVSDDVMRLDARTDVAIIKARPRIKLST